MPRSYEVSCSNFFEIFYILGRKPFCDELACLLIRSSILFIYFVKPLSELCRFDTSPITRPRKREIDYIRSLHRIQLTLQIKRIWAMFVHNKLVSEPRLDQVLDDECSLLKMCLSAPATLGLQLLDQVDNQ